MSPKYHVLLDDGNRIIIPQGNFKILFNLYLYHSGHEKVKKFDATDIKQFQ